jgi:hypothetical protein
MADVMPYTGELAAAESMAELAQLWQKYAAGVPPELSARMSADWDARAAELRADTALGRNPEQVATAREALDRIDLESLQATLDYADANNAFAEAHTRFKSLRAKKYLLAKAGKLLPEGITDARELGKVTNGEAEMIADADDEVQSARLQAYITEGQVKAVRSKLDHLERSFQYHRSLMVREDRVDSR